MDTNTANDNREMLAEEFKGQAHWRRQKAEEYPNDARNMKAAELLEKLAETVTDCPDELIFDYLHFGEDEEFDEDKLFKFQEVKSERFRFIGFGWHPATAEEVLRSILTEAN